MTSRDPYRTAAFIPEPTTVERLLSRVRATRGAVRVYPYVPARYYSDTFLRDIRALGLVLALASTVFVIGSVLVGVVIST